MPTGSPGWCGRIGTDALTRLTRSSRSCASSCGVGNLSASYVMFEIRLTNDACSAYTERSAYTLEVIWQI